MDITYRPIGVIRSSFSDVKGMPIQPTGEGARPGTAELLPELAEGLADLEGFSHVVLLYHLHKAGQSALKVKPFLGEQTRGVFATRAPARPNPIGLSIVELLRIEGRRLHLANLDILDGTPLLDIKPYVPGFDHTQQVRSGWLEAAQRKVRTTRSDDRFE